jgi:hypothetical protein
MTWYDSAWKQRQPIAIDASATGDSAVNPRDVEVTIPSDWDLFWDNIRSDFFDVIAVSATGQLLSFSRKSGADFANRILTLEIDGYGLKGQTISIGYVYFANPDQSSDLAVSTTISTPLAGYIELSRPTAFLVSQPLLRSPSSVPQSSFVKSSTDEIDIYFAVSNLFGNRATKYNNRLLYEGIDYVNVLSLDSNGTNDTGRYDEDETRFIAGHVRVRAKGGSDSTDYALVCRVYTTETQQIDIRCLIQVRDQLPSS